MKKSLGPKTLIYPNPVFIVGSYDGDKKPNLMNAAWGGVCCSAPPCVSVGIRKQRKTYENIMSNNAFTVSFPSEAHVAEADYVGIVSGHDHDKFAEAGLTPVESTVVSAPYVEEFPVVMECSVLHSYEIGAHVLFVGEIKDVKVDESVIDDDGNPSVSKIKPVVFDFAQHQYYGVGAPLAKAFSVGKEIGESK